MENPQSEHSNEFKYPKESTPENIQIYGGDEDDLYDVYKLIAIAESLPEETVPVDILVKILFASKVWEDADGTKFSPQDILNIVEAHKQENQDKIDWEKLQEEHPKLRRHFSQLGRVHYRTPLILLGEDKIIDGNHRLLKAYLEGATEIPVKRFSELPDSALLSAELRAKITGEPEAGNGEIV